MELENLDEVIRRLFIHWNIQGIDTLPFSNKEIEILEQENKMILPNDFIRLYTCINGMENLFPNETDSEGFLFYPVQAITSAKMEFKNSDLSQKNNLYVFANYMQKSWWYGLEVIDRNNYKIGIIPHGNFFKPITNLLSEFLFLYLEDSPRLYNY
jgi:hypothetical protein